jgi:murein L,D-transpeptidase YafK
MSTESFKRYQEKIVYLMRLLREKDSLDIIKEDTKEHYDITEDKRNTVIPFRKIK